MKKLIKVTLLILALFTMLPMVCSADSDILTINIGNVTSSAGQKIEVPIILNKVPQSGISYFYLEIQYNADVLEFQKINPGELIKDQNELSYNNKAGTIYFLFSQESENSMIGKEGTLASIEFLIRTSSSNQSLTISSASAVFVDSNYDYIQNTVTNGTITIAGGGDISFSDVTAVITPSGASIGANTITANVSNAARSITVNVTTSANAVWKLYSDADCTNEISNKKINLNVGSNTAYIKVTAQDNITAKIYTLTITREASGADDGTETTKPPGGGTGSGSISTERDGTIDSSKLNISGTGSGMLIDIKTDEDVEFSLPAEPLQINQLRQLEQLAKEKGKTAYVEISRKSVAGVTPEGTELKLIGKTYEFAASAVIKDASGTVDEQSRKSIAQLGNKISIKIKYTDQDVVGINSFDKLGVYTLTDNGEWKYVRSKVDKENKTLVFSVPNSGKYAIMEYTKTFSDVPAGNWAKDYIEILAARQITKGIDENNFAPSGTVTRAQFAAFIVRALGIDAGQYKGVFSDVPEAAWYAGEVEAAQNAGLIQGAGKGRFNPDAEITREEMAVMIMRAYQNVTKKSLVDEAKKTTASFKDSDAISSWAKEAVYAAQANNIINGMSAARFEPKENAQRSQVAKIIVEMLRAAGEI